MRRITMIAAVLAPGCGETGRGGTTGMPGGLTTTDGRRGSTGSTTTTSDSGSNTGPEIFDVGPDGNTGPGDVDGDCSPEDLRPTNATVTGTVFAPNMVLPISGALVYLTGDPVDPIPDGVYCAECVEIPCDTHFVYTEANGAFELPAVAAPGQQLVVQKGDFLHIETLDVPEGTSSVPVTQSNLPGEWNPGAGMWIPRIAVYETDPDKVYNVLAKFGMGTVDANGNLTPGTENFDLIPDTDQGAFMDDVNNLNRYHIIFVPCAATKFWTGAPNVPQNRIDNIRSYVETGGRWYATDHSNEYVKEPFSTYLDLHAPTMPDIQPAYTVDGQVLDPEMLAWLQALPPALKDVGGGNPTLNMLPMVQLILNYTGIDAVHEILVQDQDGNDVNVGPYTWVEGPCTSCSDPNLVRPMAITGSYGCGRLLYSTFENSSVAHQGLNPQELILMYMILEISACHGSPPPPPPPVG